MSTGYHETIFALATPPGKAGIAVIRVSGPDALRVAEILGACALEPRRMCHVVLKDPVHGDGLDQSLVVWFPAPRSFTGENVVEFHVHGGRAVVTAVLDALAQHSNAVPAEPGAFTKQAFLNGKLNLSEVEALADLIDAETAAQRRQALRGLDGGIGAFADAMRERLIGIRALTEATIDFTDEADIPHDLISVVREAVRDEVTRIDQVLAEGRVGERLRDGVTIVIAGPPNAGKSTFLNAIARRDVAIVSPFAGTTRDAIELHLDLGGYPVLLIDTAGMRETDDPVEREGVARAARRARDADIVLWLSESFALPQIDSAGSIWRIRTKSDLVPMASWDGDPPDFAVSATMGDGMNALLAALEDHVEDLLKGGVSALVTRERHRRILLDARAALSAALDTDHMELLAEDLRRGGEMLGKLSGRIDVEDVLDVIFGRFCIGK